MSSDLRISYHPRPAATPEGELEVLAAVYSFLIQRHVNVGAATTGGGSAELGGESDQSKAPSGSRGPSATDRRGDGSDKTSKRTKR